MKIRVLGGGWYGAHLSLSLLRDGHDVELHEIGPNLFCGASGRIPARLHAGALHYPRSHATRKACLEHRDSFMAEYGFMTRGVPMNIYAIAQDVSLIDFQTYREVLQRDLEFITIHDPAEYGLRNVEGAVLCGERHIVSDLARAWFEDKLAGHVFFFSKPEDDKADWTIDCTFAANSAIGVSRYEPCIVLALEGATDKAVTIMDGPFGSLYPWNEDKSLCSLSSAKYTPFSKDCKTYAHARAVLDSLSKTEIEHQGEQMIASMETYFPSIREYRVADYMLSIRAMPLSGADTRLVDVRRDGEKLIRIRAGKIDAIIAAEKAVKEIIAIA